MISQSRLRLWPFWWWSFWSMAVLDLPLRSNYCHPTSCSVQLSYHRRQLQTGFPEFTSENMFSHIFCYTFVCEYLRMPMRQKLNRWLQNGEIRWRMSLKIIFSLRKLLCTAQLFPSTDNGLSQNNSHYSSAYVKNFTFPQNFDKRYNPLTFIKVMTHWKVFFLK